MKEGESRECFVERHPCARRPGFALVLSLVLTGLLLIIVLAVSHIAKSSMQEQRPALLELQARQQAKLGLAVAIGRLKTLASQDARAIASM